MVAGGPKLSPGFSRISLEPRNGVPASGGREPHPSGSQIRSFLGFSCFGVLGGLAFRICILSLCWRRINSFAETMLLLSAKVSLLPDEDEVAQLQAIVSASTECNSGERKLGVLIVVS